MYHYQTVATATDDGKQVYGLMLSEDGELLCIRHGISPDRVLVEHIARLCTQEQVEPVHMDDVVYDMTH